MTSITTHPNVSVVDRMTQAALSGDRVALDEVFCDDLRFHMRGPIATAGDHDGVDGFLAALGALFEATGGHIDLEQKFCIGDGDWAAEWEHAVLHRNGEDLESDNAFVYRFRDGHIAEMWMYLGARPELAGPFFS